MEAAKKSTCLPSFIGSQGVKYADANEVAAWSDQKML
jgi:hypothetical protein